jgi:beta-lactamase superfamily II metal-dependent hydrolase
MKRHHLIAICVIALAVAILLGCLVFGVGGQRPASDPPDPAPSVTTPSAPDPSDPVPPVTTQPTPDPPDPTPSITDEVTVHILNVGEGLSVFIDDGEVEVLIDGGYKGYGKHVSEYIAQYVDGDIEYVIATHSDSDHVGGLIQVYADYQVNCTIYGNESVIGNYPDFKQAALSEPDSVYRNDTDETLELGEDVTLQTIDVTDDDTKPNNNSIIALLDTGASKLLVTGDAEKKAERLLSGKIGRVDVYVVGHHGSETSSSQDFLNEIRPAYGIISTVGPTRDNHNPDWDVMDRLSKADTKLYTTYRSGDIAVTFKGDTILFSPPTAEQITLQNYQDAA